MAYIYIFINIVANGLQKAHVLCLSFIGQMLNNRSFSLVTLIYIIQIDWSAGIGLSYHLCHYMYHPFHFVIFQIDHTILTL